MAIIVGSGFTPGNNEPIDTRFTVANANGRFSFAKDNVFEGLTVYQRDTDKYYILVDTANSGSNSGWREVVASSGSFAITGSLYVTGSLTGSNVEVEGTLNISHSLSIQFIEESIGSDGATVVDSFATNSFNGAIYDYVLLDTTVGCRTGQFFVTQDNSLIDFTDVSTKDVGNDAVKPSLSAAFNSTNVEVSVTNGSGYTFKAMVKKI